MDNKLKKLRDERFRDPELQAQMQVNSHYFAFCEGFECRDKLDNEALKLAVEGLEEAVNSFPKEYQRQTKAYKALAEISKRQRGE